MSSKVAASVSRLPSIILTSIPVLFAKSVADFPPPWTRILGPSTVDTIFKNDLSLGSHNINTNVDYLSSGIYFVKISGANGQNKNIKFIKK